jgi:hypothetical protein
MIFSVSNDLGLPRRTIWFHHELYLRCPGHAITESLDSLPQAASSPGQIISPLVTR